MVRTKVKDLLAQKGYSKYWLYKRMGLGYQNLSNIIEGKTTAMKYDTMEKLCRLLECTPNDLFEIEYDL